MKATLSDQDLRAITDFRILYSTLVSLYAGINRGRAAYHDFNCPLRSWRSSTTALSRKLLLKQRDGLGWYQ